MKYLLIASLLFHGISSFGSESGRSREIHFEDDLVEGVNKKPLDSFNQISEIDQNQRLHLYRKRFGFTDRNRELRNEWNINH